MTINHNVQLSPMKYVEKQKIKKALKKIDYGHLFGSGAANLKRLEKKAV